MRVPIELLSGLANCLLNETVFEIVKGLMEIQHVTEKHLFQQRLQIINKHTCKNDPSSFIEFVFYLTLAVARIVATSPA